MACLLQIFPQKRRLNKGVQVIYLLLVIFQFTLGVFVARDGVQAPPDLTNIILLLQILHLLPVAAFPLSDLLPQQYSRHLLLVS